VPGVTVIPGVPVDLTDTQISLLKDNPIESEIPIPQNSGVYERPDGIQLAEHQMYPGHRAKVNPVTGEITMVKTTPLYAVETV